MRTIHITRKISELEEHRWSFCAFENGDITLNSFVIFKRETKRHKMKASDWYDSFRSRDNTIKEIDVSIPDDVKEQAIQEVVSSLRVIKWEERRK